MPAAEKEKPYYLIASVHSYIKGVVKMIKAINGSRGRKAAMLTISGVCCFALSSFAGEIWLSDIAWTTATVGWGEMIKDQTIDPNHALITLDGTVYPKGLGVHATSEIIYDLAGGYTTFSTDVGVDDEVGTNPATVSFQIYVDGTLAFNSGVMTYNSVTQHASVSVAGRNQLRLVVTDGGDGINYDHGDWAGAKLVQKDPPPPPQNEIWLSDIAWTSASTGWGTMYKDRTIDPARHTFTLSGVTYAKGLGVNAASVVIYDLDRQYKTFVTDIGVDDEVGNQGSVEFYVLVVGEYHMDSVAYFSGVMTGSSPTQHVSVNVSGKYSLRLIVSDGGDSASYDHADWAGAKLVKNDAVKVTSPDRRQIMYRADGGKMPVVVMKGAAAIQAVDLFNLQGRYIGKASLMQGTVGSGFYTERFPRATAGRGISGR